MILLTCRDRHRVTVRVKSSMALNTVWIERWAVRSSLEWRCRWKTCTCKPMVVNSPYDRHDFHHHQALSCYVACVIITRLDIQVPRLTITYRVIIATVLMVCDPPGVYNSILEQFHYPLTIVDDVFFIIKMYLSVAWHRSTDIQVNFDRLTAYKINWKIFVEFSYATACVVTT